MAESYPTKATLREACEQEDEMDDSETEVIGKRRDRDDEILNLDSRRVARPILTEDDSPDDAEEYTEEVGGSTIQGEVVGPTESGSKRIKR